MNLIKNIYCYYLKNGATREALTKTQVENLEVILPPLIEINRFVKTEHQINKLKFA